MTQIPLEPQEFWTIVVAGGLVFVLFPLLLTADKTQERAQGLRKSLGLAGLSQSLFLLASTVWALILIFLLMGMALAIWEIISQAIPKEGEKETQSLIWELRFSIARLAGLTATIGAVIALPITLIKLKLNREANSTATDSLFNDKLNALNDKLNAATTDLLAMRQRSDGGQNVWEDDVTRRNAAIDRLEGLANERPDIAPRVSRLLSVYVRELSREEPADNMPDFKAKLEDDFSISTKTKEKKIVSEIKAWARSRQVKRSDVENAVQVLGRLQLIENVSREDIQIDLRRANLQGFNLEGLSFDNANFASAVLFGARLVKASLQDTNFLFAQLQGSNLSKAQGDPSDITAAEMTGALIKGADFGVNILKQAEEKDAVLDDDQLKRVSDDDYYQELSNEQQPPHTPKGRA